MVTNTDLDLIPPDDVLNRPMVYVENGVTYYRASSLLQCPRAFIFARQGQPTRIPANLQTAFDYGTANESRVIDILRQRGHAIESPQFEVGITVYENIIITGHLDGYIDKAVLEVKCLSHDNTEKFRDDWIKHFPYYAWQISVYMIATGFPGIFAILDKTTDEVHEIAVPNPPISLELIGARIAALENYYSYYQSTDQLPECDTTTFCPYFHLHKDYADDVPMLPLQTSALVVAYKTVSDKIAALEETKSKLRDRLDTALAGIDKARTDHYSVSVTTYPSTRIKTNETKAFLREAGKWEELTTTTEQTRLTVTKLEGDE